MKALLYGLIIVMGISVMGCETTEGIGRDVENLGDEMQDV